MAYTFSEECAARKRYRLRIPGAEFQMGGGKHQEHSPGRGLSCGSGIEADKHVASHSCDQGRVSKGRETGGENGLWSLLRTGYAEHETGSDCRLKLIEEHWRAHSKFVSFNFRYSNPSSLRWGRARRR